jgi:hypothetical protein
MCPSYRRGPEGRARCSIDLFRGSEPVSRVILMMPQCYLITPPDRLSSDLTIQYVIRPVLAQHLFEVEEADPRFISMRMLRLPLCIAYLPHGDANVYHQIQLREQMNRPLIPIIRKGFSIPREVTRQLILVIDDDLTAARHALGERTRQILGH